MPPKRLHHVQITIPSDGEAQARDFYVGILGLSEIEKPDSLKARGGFWLELGGMQIHVGIEDDVDRYQLKSHLAYQVDDLEHWRMVIIKQGLPILESIPISGYDRFECRDPFGNRVEFIQPID